MGYSRLIFFSITAAKNRSAHKEEKLLRRLSLCVIEPRSSCILHQNYTKITPLSVQYIYRIIFILIIKFIILSRSR